MTRPPVVLIEWRDSLSASSGWITVADSRRFAAEAYDSPLLAAGFLLEDNERFLVLAVGWNPSPDEAEVNGALMIPRSEVVSITRLSD